jgi:cysteine desulfurase
MKTKIAPIYLDYMAATPLDTEVLAAMLPYYQDPLWCANPSSTHHWLGQQAAKVVEDARSQIASCIGAKPQELIFTSGATEANNLALFGAARAYQRQGKHLITLSTEHKAVLNVYEELARNGFEVTYLTPSPSGVLSLSQLQAAFRRDTILVSMMYVNNEIGVIQEIEQFAAWTKSQGAIFHVDAAQAVGRLPIDLACSKVDLMSFSSHKIYGPKGIGALFVRQKPKIRLQPLIFGGQQEQGLRPGTLATPLIVGMAKAFCLAEAKRAQEQQVFLSYRQQLREVIDSLGDIIWHGDWMQRVPANLNFSILGVDASDLISNLYPLIVSNQSACSAALNAASHVLLALGCEEHIARSAIRLSLGRMTTEAEIKNICDIMLSRIPQLR